MGETIGKNVSLTQEQHRFVKNLVDSGRYSNASEVVRSALRLLERAEHRRLLEKWFASELTADEEAQLGPELMKRAREAADRWLHESLGSGAPEEADEAWIAERRRELDQRLSGKPKKRA